MADWAERLDQLTTEQLSGLDTAGLERLEAYMKEREELFLLIRRHEWSEEEIAEAQPAMRRVLAATPALLARMEALKAEAGAHLGKMAASRKQTSGYHPAYEPDSVFIEKKY